MREFEPSDFDLTFDSNSSIVLIGVRGTMSKSAVTLMIDKDLNGIRLHGNHNISSDVLFELKSSTDYLSR